MAAVAQNLASVREELRQQGIDASSISILGVTKLQPIEKIREALSAGVRILGNNYLQEGQELITSLEGSDIEWHFIGHIQSRKAKSLTGYHCVQSLDRIEVARKLDEKLGVEGRRLDVLVEVNLGEEPQKSGVLPAEVEPFLESLSGLRNLGVRGLMGMPPPLSPIEERRPFFRRLRELAERHHLKQLSMGTSEDFLIAAQEGATMLRLGTRLFGERHRK